MRARKPVLFLDFDGVIAWVPQSGNFSAVQRLLLVALARLDRLVALARPRVVVSSTWRIMPEPEPGRRPLVAADVLNGWLREAGSRTVVEGVTPQHEACRTQADVERVRGGEIAHWLSLNAAPGTPWCALDDMSLQGCERLVLVGGPILSDADVERAVDLLRPLTEEDVRFLSELGDGGWVPLRQLRGWRDLRSLRDGLLARGLLEAGGRGRNRALRVTVAGSALIA